MDIINILIIIGIIVLIILLAKESKDTNNKIHKRIIEIEKESEFINKVDLLKREIEEKSEVALKKRIIYHTDLFIKDAIKRSTSVSKGKIIEHLAPIIMPEILCPTEVVFIGSPIDLISFKGIDDNKRISIDFFEIKSGNSYLNKKQKLIRDAIFAKRVYFKSMKIN